MIKLYLGKPGSGKSLSAVMEMVENIQHISFYTNIKPKKPKLTPQITSIKTDMLVKKELKGVIKKKGGGSDPVYDWKLNEAYWKELQGQPKTVVLDEFHTIMDARRAMSKPNKIMGDFLALIRRIIGDDPMAQGDLILITQLGKRADVIAREMAHQVVYHVMHYTKYCQKCRTAWHEHSDMPDQAKVCIACGHYRLGQADHYIEKFHFDSVNSFNMWEMFGKPQNQWFYSHYYVTGVSQYFGYYDTVQWDNMLSELYE